MQLQVQEIVKEDKENYQSQERQALVRNIELLVSEFKEKSAYECDEAKPKLSESRVVKQQLSVDPYTGVVLWLLIINMQKLLKSPLYEVLKFLDDRDLCRMQ